MLLEQVRPLFHRLPEWAMLTRRSLSFHLDYKPAIRLMLETEDRLVQMEMADVDFGSRRSRRMASRRPRHLTGLSESDADLIKCGISMVCLSF